MGTQNLTTPLTRFQVDFQCGCCLHPRPDIAFHFNPRFYTVKPHVICNTLQGGLWQKEVRWPGVALQRGASFLILFLFENEEVKVSGKVVRGSLELASYSTAPCPVLHGTVINSPVERGIGLLWACVAIRKCRSPLI